MANDLDKYYTNNNIAAYCKKIYIDYIPKDIEIVEPSAGNGSFIDFTDIWLDIEPEHKDITKQDFFDFDTSKYKYYLGNPPFGKNSSLAKRFFNHAAKGNGVIGFILPRTFRKHTITNSLDLNFHLVYEEILEPNSFTENGKAKSVPCIFQVWEYRKDKREKIVLKTTHSDFKFLPSKEGCDFSLRRVGVNAGKINPNNDFSPSSNYFIAGNVEDSFREMESDMIEASRDTAGNPSIGKGEIVRIYSKKKLT